MKIFELGKAKSPWILHYNTGSCNGCDIELLAVLTPRYDVERFGMLNKGNPKQADILLITGPVTKRCRERLLNLYLQVPEPKVVVAVGTCSCGGGVFRHMYNVENGVERVIPVDVYVPGCAARPQQIIDGVVKALQILREKGRALEVPPHLKKIVRGREGGIDRESLLEDLRRR